MARTKQRRTYLPYTFPAVAELIYRPREDGGLSKPRLRMQRATGPRLLRDSPQPADLNPRPRDRWSSVLTTRHRASLKMLHVAEINTVCLQTIPHIYNAVTEE